jgi:glycosyltransferase involved in cell wall biosynthesis
MKPPKVSICVPNLNTRPFLPERFTTIFNQTLDDWELLVYDSHSADGAWEYIEGLAAREPRMRCWQGPREGTPGSWNPCIRRARGEYVYIATSDDTMPPDCLEKLAAALDRHPECDLAHCRLRAIDERGADREDWWSDVSVFALSSGPLVDQLHVRPAPLDGLLHLAGDTVYTSITQLLIRRSLFDRIGFFERIWGSIGDFNWSMRAGLVASTVHVPDTWGGWRVHASQSTATANLGSTAHALKIDAMIDHAILSTEALMPTAIGDALRQRWSRQAAQFRVFNAEITNRLDPIDRRSFIVRQLLSGSGAARSHVRSKLLDGPSWREYFPTMVRGWLKGVGVDAELVPVAAAGANVGIPA